MKNTLQKTVLLLTAIFSFGLTSLFAQVPQAINFQAIARDAESNPMVNTNIQIRLSVVDETPEGTVVYQELRALQTNAYGSFSFQIGVGANFVTIGTMQEIEWENGSKFLKIDYDPTNTFTFNLTLGTIEFVSVPYAFAAETVVFIDATGAENGDVLVYNEATGKFEPGTVTAGSVTWENVQNKPDFSNYDTDVTDDFSGDYNDLTNLPTIPTAADGSETKIQSGTNVTLTGTGTLANPYIINSSAVGTSLNGTNIGDMQYWNGTEWVILPAGTQGQMLSVNSSNIPTWQSAGAPGLNPPVAVSLAASTIESFTTQLNGTVNANGLSTTVVFEWGTTTSYGQTTNATPQTVTGTTNTAVNKTITGLQSNTTYHYRVKATNAVDITYSEDMSFTTALSAPQLTTTAISNTLAFSASSGGNITYDGGSPVTTRGVCWSTSPNPTTANTYVASGSGTGSFTINLTSLTHNTTYYLRAYATNAVGTTYGNELTFTTQSGVVSLTTNNIIAITGITATSGGNITADGGSPVIARGVCWNTSSGPTLSHNFTNDGSGIGTFNSNLADLIPGTIYYVRAYATNLVGTTYGNEIIFVNDGLSNWSAEIPLALQSQTAWATYNGTAITIYQSEAIGVAFTYIDASFSRITKTTSCDGWVVVTDISTFINQESLSNAYSNGTPVDQINLETDYIAKAYSSVYFISKIGSTYKLVHYFAGQRNPSTGNILVFKYKQ